MHMLFKQKSKQLFINIRNVVAYFKSENNTGVMLLTNGTLLGLKHFSPDELVLLESEYVDNKHLTKLPITGNDTGYIDLDKVVQLTFCELTKQVAINFDSPVTKNSIYLNPDNEQEEISNLRIFQSFREITTL